MGMQQRASTTFRTREKCQSTLELAVVLYRKRKGAAHGFRYKDFLDYTSNTIGNVEPQFHDVTLGTATGSSPSEEFQVVKRYTSGATTFVRNITKPGCGSCLCWYQRREHTVIRWIKLGLSISTTENSSSTVCLLATRSHAGMSSMFRFDSRTAPTN